MTPVRARRLLVAVALFVASAFLAVAPSEGQDKKDEVKKGDKKKDDDKDKKGPDGKDKDKKGDDKKGPDAKAGDKKGGDDKKDSPKKDPDKKDTSKKEPDKKDPPKKDPDPKDGPKKDPPGKDGKDKKDPDPKDKKDGKDKKGPTFTRHTHAYTENGKNKEMAYWVFVPEKAKDPPSILFLHGHGGRLDGEVSPIGTEGPGAYIQKHREKFEFLVVIPQADAPRGGPNGWGGANAAEALKIFDAVVKQYNGDLNRRYLTGFSMGGSGVWNIAYADPTRWAAIAPAAGWTYQLAGDAPKKLAGLPCWCFHGAKDSANAGVDPKESERMIDAINEVAPKGAKAKFSLLKDEGHICGDAVYTDALFDWFLKYPQKKK